MVIRSVLALRPKAGAEDDLVALFQRDEVFERAMTVEGCLDVSMLKRDQEILVIGSWASPDAYDAWINHPERNSSSDELNELLQEPLTSDSVATLYEVVLDTHEGSGS